MNVNFFQWLRDGVKHSVLLGVSDAVDTLGTPDNIAGDEKQTLAFLTQTKGTRGTKRSRSKSVANQPERKRLGRSLKDMDQPASK